MIEAAGFEPLSAAIGPPPGDRFGCAPVTRRRFPVGARPTRRPLQPEAAGADMEATKCLKPSGNGHEFGDRASVQAATRVNAEQASHGVDVQADPATLPGKAATAG